MAETIKQGVAEVFRSNDSVTKSPTERTTQLLGGEVAAMDITSKYVVWGPDAVLLIQHKCFQGPFVAENSPFNMGSIM